MFCSSLVILITAFSQKADRPFPQASWHVQELSSATGNFHSPASFKKSILYLDNEAVCAVQFSKEEWGVVKISSTGKELWNYKVKNPLVGIARMGENIIFFHAEVGKFSKVGTWGLTRTLHAVLVSGKNGSLIAGKVIFDNSDWAFIDYRVLTRPDHELSAIALRVSNCKGRSALEKQLRERLTSAKLQLLKLSNDLTVQKTTQIASKGMDGLFQGMLAGNNNDFFFCSWVDDQLTVELFELSGSAKGKLTANAAVRMNDMILEPVATVDTFEPSTLFVGLYYKNKDKDMVNQAMKFDFAGNKVTGTGEEELNKSFRKTLEPNKTDELKKGDLDYIDKLKVIDVVSTEEKIAVLREIQFTNLSGVNSGGLWYRNENLVISIYDRQWKLTKTITLDKRYLFNNEIGQSVGIHVEDDKLRLVMSAMDGSATHAVALAVVNLKNDDLEEFTTINKYNVSTNYPIEGGASLWFPGSILIEHLIPQGGAFKQNRDYFAVWQKLSW